VGQDAASPGPALARAGAQVACALLCAGTGAWALALRPSAAGDLAVLAGGALVLVTAGLAAHRLVPVTWGTALLGAAYLAGRFERPVPVLVPAAYGTAMLLVMETAWLSIEMRAGVRWAPAAGWRRWAALGGLAAGGCSLAVLAGAAGEAGAGAGTAVLAAGTAGALVLAVALARAVRARSG
jgi:hypothetical protein